MMLRLWFTQKVKGVEMKLLYLYVETWPQRGISKKNPIRVNFDCGYKFHYDPDTNALSYEQGEELPNGFFSVSADNGCVDSVSVIIGDNGTGKTTIASVLGYLFQRGHHLPEYVCIYQENQKLVIYWHFEDNRAAPDRTSIKGEWVDAESNPEYTDVLKHNCPFDIVYYSPYFSTSGIWPGIVMGDMVEEGNLPLYDISTGYLVKHRKASDSDVTQVESFEMEDRERVLRFAHNYVNTFSVGIDRSLLNDDESGLILPLPTYAQFLVDTMMLVEDALEELDNRALCREENSIQDIICNQDCDNPLWVIASTILVYLSFSEETRGRHNDFAALKGILYEVCGAAKKMAAQTSNIHRGREFAKAVSRIKAQDRNHIVHTVMAVLLPMARIYGKTVDSRREKGYVLGWQVDISKNEDFDDVIDVIRNLPTLESSIGDLVGNTVSLMKVSLANMSSGEMAYWTLFARLYDVFRNKMPKDDKRDILLFLDEAETTLHPMWQQQLVRNVIWFLEKYVNDKAKDGKTRRRVHVIFATHSPMILSDVPKGNVAFLIKDRQDPAGKVIQSETEMRTLLGEVNDTFGANVFDMYYRLFFLAENGGRFSTDKMKNVVKTIHRILLGRKSIALSKEDWWLLDHAGDPQVQKYFDSVKPLIQNAMK